MPPSGVFILGATGYIGGSVLKGLLAAYPQLPVTALVRNEKDIEAVRATGVSNVIHGSYDDLDRVRDIASQADIVVNAADANDLPLTKAVLEGLKARAHNVSFRPILIHTSGTGVVVDDVEGEFAESGQKIWNDNSEEDIRSIPPEKPHRLVDLEIFQADAQKHISGYIIAPSTIFGTGSGPGNKISVQIPSVVQTAVKRKGAVHIGKGTNKWMNVHINDLVNLYLLVFALAISGEDNSGSYAKFYFGSVHEHVWGEIIAHIAKILHEKGIIPSSVTKGVPLKEEPGLRFTSHNSRTASDRGFALGWRPKSRSIEETLEEDVEATLAKMHKEGRI